MIYSAISTLNLPVKVVVAYGRTEFVKPNPELFWHDTALRDFDKNESFFVGDAAGGVEWSDSDLKFAENVGITFKTPEEIFPITLVHPLHNDQRDFFKDSQEMVILVGYQAIGKTTFAENKFVTHGYIRIDGDSLKTPAKIIKESEKHLQLGKSVVIDATNGKFNNRQLFITLANKYNTPVRCFVFNTSIETAMEWNTKRFLEIGKKIPKIAFYTYRKNYNPPTMSECPIVNI
jgi:bifunctional polynucleotide phosphatase/kinase